MAKCGEKLDTDNLDLTCDQPKGHDGPTHSDGGHEWGDASLPLPMPEQPETD